MTLRNQWSVFWVAMMVVSTQAWWNFAEMLLGRGLLGISVSLVGIAIIAPACVWADKRIARRIEGEESRHDHC